MANYTKVFDNPYPDGWENLPSENTPITAEALQEHTDAIENIEQYLEDNPIKDATDVEWNQVQKDGTKIAEITIDGETQEVFAPQGGGGTAEFVEMTKAQYDALPDTKLTDSVPRLITDYSEGGSSQEIYDDTERIIGTWFGKPLYRKTWILNNNYSFSSFGWSDFSEIKIDNVKAITRMEVIGLVNNIYSNLKFNVTNENLSTNGLHALNMRNVAASVNSGSYVILEYTKDGD